MGLHDGHRQRKRERFLKQGADGLADHEVLELLLYYAIPRRDTNELAHRLIQHFGTLDAVFQAPPEALMQVPGIGENAAVLLNLVPAAQRCARRSVSAERILNSVERCGAYFMDLLDGQRRELLYQVCLDGKGKVLSCKCLSQGSADMTSLSIRQVVENAPAVRRRRRGAGPQSPQRRGSAVGGGPGRHPAGAGRSGHHGHPPAGPHHRGRR